MSQDVIYMDKERMTKIQTLVDKPQDGHGTKSIIHDLGEKCISNTFSEASRRTIKDLGNIELYDLGEISKTVQCPSCLKYSQKGTVYCLCGILVMLSLEQTEKIKNRIEIISNPLLNHKKGQSGERHGPAPWQYDHWKAKDATANVHKRGKNSIVHRLLTHNTQSLNGHMDGLLSTASTWTTSKPSM